MEERIQNFGWGVIKWLYLPDSTSSNNMHIGISTMWPHAVQARHVHCGDEQMMYIISGHGKQYVGNDLKIIEPGQVIHIPAGSIHETMNDSDEPIVKLLISIPASLSAQKVSADNNLYRDKNENRESSREILLSAIKQLYDRLISPLKMPVAFFDNNYELLLRNDEYPEYCKIKCGVDEDIYRCRLYNFKDGHTPPYYADASAFVCPYGIALYSLAISLKGNVIGIVKSGHVRVSISDDCSEPDQYDVPQSTIDGILHTMHQIIYEICEVYQLEEMKLELDRQEYSIYEQQVQRTILEKSLKNTQSEMFNLQIGQHFLFNTLSSIASMAIRDNAMSTYNAVNDLTQLFRYTLRTNKLFVELREELEYLENYTSLQGLRYESRLKVTYICPPSLLSEMVPFNFIQPIVENCFKHAFKKGTANVMQVTICVKKLSSNLSITVKDNGCGIDDSKIKIIDRRIQGIESGGGTAMLVNKLSSLYRNNYSIEVKSLKKGTQVCVTIPSSKESACI